MQELPGDIVAVVPAPLDSLDIDLVEAVAPVEEPVGMESEAHIEAVE